MISPEQFKEIVYAVKRAGGDLDHVKDLVDVWERLERRLQPLEDAMRRQAQAVRCYCGGGGEPDSAGHCSRCFGQTGVNTS